MGRRTIWRLTGASFAATFVSVLFPFLLHLSTVPFCISASQSNASDNTSNPELQCDCNSSSFCYDKTCVPLLNLNLTVLAVTSKALTFSWSIIDVKKYPNVSLHLSCTELNNCSCEANVDEEFRRSFTIYNLSSSLLLLFEAVAQFNNTNVSHPINKTVLTPPVLPDNISASNENSTTVKVEWTNYIPCVHTRLEILNANNTILANASVSDGYALIESLVQGTRSNLQVRAVVTADAKVEKSNTSLLSVTTRPMPPEGLVTTKRPFSLNITFKAPSIGRYDYFQLEYLLSNGTWTPAGKTNSTTNFVLISGLQPFSTYQLRAQSVAFGVFSPHYEENVTTGEFKPSSPTVVEHNSSLVFWKSPDTPNGIILSYELDWTLSCGKFVQVKKQTFTILASNLSWPMPSGFELLGYRHCVRIRAKNSFSFGNWSSNSCLSKPVDSTLSPKLNISASSDNASVAWSSTTCPGFVIGYFLLLQRRNPDNSGRMGDACLPGSRRLTCSKCNYPDTNNLFASLTSLCGDAAINETFENEKKKIEIISLQPGDIYHVTLYSAGSNRSLYNISGNFSTQQVLSNQPQNLSVIAPSDKALTATWAPPRAPGGLLLHYLAWIDAKPPQCLLCNCTGCESRADYVKLTEQGKQQLENAVRGCQTSYNCTFKPEEGPRSSAKFDNLPAFTNFTVYVSGVNSLGLGSSNASAQNATQEGKPDPPTWINITKVTDTSVMIVWSKSPNPKGIPRAYFVVLNNSGGSKRVNHTVTRANFTNLSACAAYEASVTVANSFKNSSHVTSNKMLTHPTQPAPVSDLQLLVIKSTELKASWNQTENVGNCTVSYRVVLKSAGIEKVKKTQKDASFVFQSLQPFTAYTVEVVAIVTSGDGSRLESLPRNSNNTTEEDAPSPPRNLRCYPKNHTSIHCTWEEPIPTNGRIQYYEVRVQPRSLHSPYNVSGTDSSTIFTMPKSVSSGESISVFVKAFTSVKPGKPATNKTQLSDGPPDVNFTQEIKNEMGKDANNVVDKLTQVRVNYNTGWFNSKRGKITHLAIIVRECCKPLLKMINSETTVDSTISTWHGSDVGRTQPYAAVKINTAERRRRKRSISDPRSVVIGNQHCPKKNIDYCNGPLKPDTKYEMYIRVYTSNAFSTLGPVTTTTMPPSNSNLIIGLVVGFLLLVVLIAVGIAFYQWRKRDIDTSSTLPKNGSVNPFVPSGNTQMTLFNATNASVSELAQMVSEGREVDVPVEQFEEFVEDMNKDSRLKYTDAFNEVKKRALKNETDQGLTVEEAGQQYNRLKNRFANVLPFDQTRVCLSSDDDPFSGMDYINANFVAGYRRQREFIACQGPLPQTVDDFWRMVWEQNIHLIVMLTKIVEKGRNKCEQYWPSEIDETCVYGDIAVRLLSESVVNSHIVRVCSLTLKGDDSRVLTHLQMITWDDFLAPSPEDLTKFMRTYRSHLPPPSGNRSESPTVVHCSAGVGRTGTFICLDTLIRRLESGHNSINVNAVIYAMRKQRRLLVQSERQYIFIHDFLVSYLQQRNAAAAASRRDAAEGDDGSTALLDARASHVNNAYEKEDIL